MRKSIAALALLMLVSVMPSAFAGPPTPADEQIIQTTHTNVNVLEGSLGSTKTLLVGVSVYPGPPGNTYAVDYEVVPVTATRDQDFTAKIGKGTVKLNNSKGTIPITLKGDIADETNETIRIDLFNARCTGSGPCDLDSDPNPRPGYVTIADDDGKPTPGPRMSIVNGFTDATKDNVCNVEVDLDYGWDKPVSVHFWTEDLEATHPDDYDKTQGTMVLSPGQVRKSVVVPIHSDRKASARNDRFVVNFDDAKGGTLSESSGQCTFLDGPNTATAQDRHRRRRRG